ncbi:MAG: glycine/betaine transporter substrate-binding protein [Frankiales bacterium]|jgi:osmoprotectant transport system substrate-binding protein|nr:glycine/betaine transporter substrate-binding protein [Frankiales bacterium]
MRARTLIALAAGLPLLVAGCGGSSNSKLSSNGTDNSKVLVVLADDLKLQTVDNIVPVIRTKVASDAAKQALEKVSAALSVDALIGLNKSVDIDRHTSEAAASSFVKDKGLDSGVSGGSGKLVVGGANFSESQTLAYVYADALKAAGFSTEVKTVESREVYEPALERGDLDVFPEYVGTLTEFLNTKANGANAKPKASNDLDATLTALKALAGPRGLTVYAPAAADDKNAFAVTKKFAQDNKLTKISDLKNLKDLILGGPAECPKRPFCELGLEKTYGLTFKSFKSLDAGGPLTKAALKDGTINVGLVFSSDGSLGTL